MTTDTMALAGADLAYDVSGSGPAVVLVHGFGLDMRMWEPQVERLASGFRVARYDCRGFGRTGRFDPAVPYSHGEDLLALMDHLSMAEAALVGLSFGGRIVVETALIAPGRVRGLVLLDAFLEGVAWDAESAAGLDEVGRQVEEGGVEGGRLAWMAHPLFAAARQDPQLAEQLSAMVSQYPGQHWLGQDPQRPVLPSPIDHLDEISVPTLVMSGERDVPCFIEMSDILASRIPGADRCRVPGAGHMVNMEAPSVVNDLLINFLNRLYTGS